MISAGGKGLVGADAGELRIGPPRLHYTRAWQRLVFRIPRDQVRALRADVGALDHEAGSQFALQRELPVLEIAVAEVGLECFQRRKTAELRGRTERRFVADRGRCRIDRGGNIELERRIEAEVQ